MRFEHVSLSPRYKVEFKPIICPDTLFTPRYMYFYFIHPHKLIVSYFFIIISLKAGPDGSFVSTGACNLGVPVSNPGRDEYLSSWLCIYSEPLKSFEIRVGHSPGFGLPSVAIMPSLCRKRGKAIFILIFLF